MNPFTKQIIGMKMIGLGLVAWGLLAATQIRGNPVAPLILQDFNQPLPWTNNIDSTGIWKISGTWVGTGNNTLLASLAAGLTSYSGDSGAGYLALSINPGLPLEGSEIQSLPTNGYSYGYYETRMKVTSVADGCASFFLIEAPGYGPHEYDYEFLMNEAWTTNSKVNGAVHLTTHPSGVSYVLNLPFNPTTGFHRYGMLWTPGKMAWYVDGKLLHSTTSSDMTTTAQMFIMANVWSGDSTWGGGPPAQTSTTYYDWIKFWPNVTAVPATANPPITTTMTDGKLIINSSGWAPNTNYTLLGSTNATAPLTNWTKVTIGSSDSGGSIHYTNTPGAALPQFFIIRQ